MSKKKQRTKEGKEVVKRVEAAGGAVERTGKGHLKIIGPKGVAFVGSDPGSNRMEKTYETIRNETGLDV